MRRRGWLAWGWTAAGRAAATVRQLAQQIQGAPLQLQTLATAGRLPAGYYLIAYTDIYNRARARGDDIIAGWAII